MSKRLNKLSKLVKNDITKSSNINLKHGFVLGRIIIALSHRSSNKNSFRKNHPVRKLK